MKENLKEDQILTEEQTIEADRIGEEAGKLLEDSTIDLEKLIQEDNVSEEIEVTEEFKIPGTDTIVEVGDKIIVKEGRFVNVNIGVPINRKDLIQKIEKELDDLGIYYDNEGSDSSTYNINAGFDNERQGYDYSVKLAKEYPSVYVDTESFKS